METGRVTALISCHRPGEATIDAGTKAFYITLSAPTLRVRKRCRPPGIHLRLKFQRRTRPSDLPAGIGHLVPDDRLEPIVSHCDPIINLFDEFYVPLGEKVVDR